MKSYRTLGVILLVLLAFVAGGISVWFYLKSNGSNQPRVLSRATIIGSWTTSTSPELKLSATTVKFLETGEYQFKQPLVLFGKVQTAEIEGKKQTLPFHGSGKWELKGDSIYVDITQTNSPTLKAEPFVFKVRQVTEKMLVLEKGEEVHNFFRVD